MYSRSHFTKGMELMILLVTYHLKVARNDKSILIVSIGSKKFSADFQLMFRFLKLFLFVGSVIAIDTL
ncbi:hypothetical protein L1987_37242 [Smallanthus sonchifolius]|uniref:Uncharacterized protein n=1 Tax=Smallanthus sonchifolius TaxID=185202 RepID=A0ACB9HFT5_9ASTR|nr:hypothetical protein L1987_37242 [Smallanthus sonchifolius]